MGAGGVRPSGQKATLPLPTAVSMRETISETPFAATDGGGGQGTLFDVDRPAGEQLLPTPLVTSERKSRGSMVENQQWSAPSLGQAVEIAAGVLPREFDSWDEVPGELGRQSRSRLLPTPVANPENPGAGGELRAAVVHGEGRRNETGVDTLGRPNRGRGPLLPTPTTQDAENTAGPSQRERNTDPLNVAAARLLPTPTAADGDRSSEQGPRHYPGGDDNPTLLGVARRSDVEWGVYDAAIRRWEAVLGRQAPRPTDEKGRLDPPFPAWMLGYPEGWFDVEGVSRTAALRAIGNSVQVQASEEVGHWLRFLVEAGVL